MNYQLCIVTPGFSELERRTLQFDEWAPSWLNVYHQNRFDCGYLSMKTGKDPEA
jgi:hypothetical protein